MNPEPAPLVSVVIATYNRANVLAYAIRSVLGQTLADWELLVIGDACTDDTAEVVAAFNDPRIHFHNLAHNVGEQSGPNNEGVRRARGRYVAFLNHDDLWWPDHLERAVAGMDETGADLVFTLLDVIKPGGGKWKPHRLPTAAPHLRYDPRLHLPASCWVFKRELAAQVGPWRFYRDCHLIPSQDWLFRAWKAGHDLRCVPRLTVAAIPSGKRQGVYAKREFEENRRIYERILYEPDFREQELTDIALGYRMHWLEFQAAEDLVARACGNLFDKLCLKAGWHPKAVRNFLRYLRKGAYVDRLRRQRGLPALPRRRDRDDGEGQN